MVTSIELHNYNVLVCFYAVSTHRLMQYIIRKRFPSYFNPLTREIKVKYIINQ